MSRLLALAVLATALAVPASTSASTHVLYPACVDGAQDLYKPKSVIVACGDGAFQLAKLHWSSWTSSKATATGVAKVNSCKPNCASGNFKSYSVKVTLKKPKTCSGARVWHKLYVTFLNGKHPSGYKANYSVPLSCPTQQQQG
jgi:hypothetical protein